MSSLRDNYAQITQGLKSNSEFDMGLALALGLIKGATPDIKFGHSPNTTLTETDVWQYAATQPIYIFPDEAGEAMQIRSTNVADDQDIRVEILDDNGLSVEVDVTLNGTTPVPIPGPYTAVNRAYNNDSTLFIGNISIEGDGTTSSNIFAYMVPIDQQTTQCIYKVPSDKVVVIANVSTSANRTVGATLYSDFRFKSKKPGKVFRSEFVYGLQKEGSSALIYDLKIAGIYGPSNELKITALPIVTDTDVSAQFAIISIDQNLVPSNVLAQL